MRFLLIIVVLLIVSLEVAALTRGFSTRIQREPSKDFRSRETNTRGNHKKIRMEDPEIAYMEMREDPNQYKNLKLVEVSSRTKETFYAKDKLRDLKRFPTIDIAKHFISKMNGNLGSDAIDQNGFTEAFVSLLDYVNYEGKINEEKLNSFFENYDKNKDQLMDAEELSLFISTFIEENLDESGISNCSI